MERTVTPEERQILLNHPELVMFEPFRAMKMHRMSLGLSLVPPAVAAVAVFAVGLAFPDFLNRRPTLFAGLAALLIVVTSALVPVLSLVLNDRMLREAERKHFADQLRKMLPEELTCNTAVVDYIVREKAEGAIMIDGRQEPFGYASCVNIFRMEPDETVAFVTDKQNFFAFVKRDAVTEVFYR